MTPPTKAALRTELLLARRALPQSVRDAEADALRRWLPGLTGAGMTVAAYVPVGAEPGCLAMLDDATKAGVRVLLPVSHTGADGTGLPLQWGGYVPGTLVPAAFGLLEPPPPFLPTETLAEAEVILVPALAVDRTGVRLGRGAGFYDRTLAAAAPGALLVAVVRDDELVDELPGEPHDVRMTHALTPARGLVRLDD